MTGENIFDENSAASKEGVQGPERPGLKETEPGRKLSRKLGRRNKLSRIDTEPEVEPADFRRDSQEVKRDIYENLRVLVAVAVHGGFYVGWVGIMILVHWVISLMGPLEFPANIIPTAAELVVQLGVLYIIANHTWDFAVELTAYNRAKRAKRARRRQQIKPEAREENGSGSSSANSGA